MTATASIKLPARAWSTTTTTGTGTLSLSGSAPASYRTILAAASTTNRVRYTLVAQDRSLFETGIGTITAGSPDTLSRDYVEASTSGSAVSLPAGTHDVFVAATTESMRNTEVLEAPSGLTLVRSDSGVTVSNKGATGLATCTLPLASSGNAVLASPTVDLACRFAFYCDDTDGIKVLAVGSDVFRQAGRTSAAAGYLQSTVIGSYLEIVASSTSTEWIVVRMSGVWTFDGGAISAPGAGGVIGIVAADVTTSASGDGQTFTLPAGQLMTDGDTVTVDIYAQMNALTGHPNIKFGSTTFDFGSFTGTYTGPIRFHLMVARTGATAQYATCDAIYATSMTGLAHATPGETLSGSVAIKTNVSGVSGGNIVWEHMVITYKPFGLA